jgi:hypothetical protein
MMILGYRNHDQERECEGLWDGARETSHRGGTTHHEQQ